MKVMVDKGNLKAWKIIEGTNTENEEKMSLRSENQSSEVEKREIGRLSGAGEE
jgi:hypothetical protein